MATMKNDLSDTEIDSWMIKCMHLFPHLLKMQRRLIANYRITVSTEEIKDSVNRLLEDGVIKVTGLESSGGGSPIFLPLIVIKPAATKLEDEGMGHDASGIDEFCEEGGH